MLISFEGIDGCGKSTQAEMLRNKLEQHHAPFTFIREPGGTPAGEDIRNILLQNNYSLATVTELLLYMAARAEVADQILVPALGEGKVVICDRFIDSTLAYQGYGRGVGLDWIRALNYRVTGGRFPDLTFILDLPVEKAAERRGEVAVDRMERNDLYYHERVRSGYLEIARQEPQRVVLIDAVAGAEIQGQIIWQHVSNFLGRLSGMEFKDEF
ncbi:MAG: dTMP kinase [Bacillota bacterium]